MYIIKNKITGEYLTSKSYVFTKDLNKARTFSGLKNAESCKRILYDKFKVGSDYEILQITISII